MPVRPTLTSVALCLSTAAMPAVAGPLTPPGAPAPTLKTLDEVEPSIPIGPLTTAGAIQDLGGGATITTGDNWINVSLD